MRNGCSKGRLIFLFAAIAVLFVGSGRVNAEINWIGSGAALVKESYGFENILRDSVWEGTTLDPVYPRLTIGQVAIDASANKYLYLQLSAAGRTGLRIFFSPDADGNFYKNWSVNAAGLKTDSGVVVYRLNLSSVADWKGIICALKVDALGHQRGDKVRLEKIGISSDPVSKMDNTEIIELSVDTNWIMHDRMTFWHDALLRTNDTFPNSCLMTYTRDKPSFVEQYLLAKMVVGVQGQAGMVWGGQSQRAQVKDMPGAVKAEFMLGEVKVTTEFTALMEGRDSELWDGAAVYSIRTEPATAVKIRLGGGLKVNTNADVFAGKWILENEAGFEGASIETEGDTAFLKSTVHPLTVGIKTEHPLTKQKTDKQAEYIEIRLEKGQGRILLSFAEDRQHASELLKLNVDNGLQSVRDYYAKLLADCRIETPEKNIDEAFRHAVILMDYSWYKPYGWIETPHHWLATFHLQHSGGEQFIGHSDRVQQCLLQHAKHLRDSGTVPNFVPGQIIDGVFGGSNQYYFWQIREYLKYTNDVETVAKLVPAMDKILDLIFRWYDPDRDMLFAWGFQIGNQEDMLLNPYNGVVPTIEVINMMQTRAMVAKILGDPKTQEQMEIKIRQAKANLKQFWMKDLGRFMYYQDPTGKKLPDGQYQTCIYPVIWDIVDEFDGWTSMRHLRDRLTGVNGEVYLANNFPDHLVDIWATWGMQAGAAQQPWGAWGLAATGLYNETWRPLKAVSEWVMNDVQKGCWPEIAYENRIGYFSPPAGLFIQSVAEALFGLHVDKPNNVLTVAPSLPDHWPNAKLHLPDFDVDFARQGDAMRYTVKSKDAMARNLQWRLPPCQVDSVKVNGSKLKFTVKPAINGVVLEAFVSATKETTFEIAFSRLKYKLDYPASIAEGQAFKLKADNVCIEKIVDRCGVLSQTCIKNGDTLIAEIQSGLLDEYLKFGRLGQMNFSRRSFFLYCTSRNGAAFWLPVDLLILPRYEAAVKGSLALSGDGAKADLLIRNNTAAVLKGTSYLKAFQMVIPVETAIEPRSEKTAMVHIAGDHLKYLSPGDNKAVLILPDNAAINLTITASDGMDKEALAKKMEVIPLPEALLISGPQWRGIRQNYFNLHNPDDVLSGLPEGKSTRDIPQLPGVSFAINNRRFVPISEKVGRKSFELPMNSTPYKKLYLLVIPFVESHDVFSETAQIHIQLDDPNKSPQIGEAVITRRLNSPGDIDCWFPAGYMAHLGSFQSPRKDRHGILPIVGESVGDWDQARPPGFPQPEYWSSSLAVDIGTILNVIEIDLGEARKVKSLRFTTTGVDPGFGLVAVTGEKE